METGRLMLLSIDASDNKQTIVKLDDLEIIEKYNSPREQKLLEVIEKALKEKRAKLKNIGKIEVNIGPGSFTGLRVGCAVANTLAWVLNIKVNGEKRVFPKYS